MKLQFFTCFRVIVLIALLFGLGWTPKPVHAAIFTVDSVSDNPDFDLKDNVCKDQYNYCTLRAAIEQINYSGGASNTITIGTASIPVSTLPRIKKNLIINGNGYTNTIIRGNGLDQVGLDTDNNLSINDLTLENFDFAVTSNYGTLEINYSKISKNNYMAITSNGKATSIFQSLITENNNNAIHLGSGELTVNNSLVNKTNGNNCAVDISGGKALFLDSILSENKNISGNGGAMCIRNYGRVILDNTIVNSNSATGNGGGIYMEGYNSQPELWITSSSEINSNKATKGGGIYLGAGYLNIEGGNSIIKINNNEAVEAGGGIYSSSNKENLLQGVLLSNNSAANGGGMYTATSGNFIIHDSAFISNRATAGDGGAIYNNINHRRILNTTFSGNQATNHGGAIYTKAGIFDLSNVTITENTCNSDSTDGGQGGGIFVENDAKLDIRNSIVAGNSDIKVGMFDFSAPEIHGTITSYGYNLFGVITDWLVITNTHTGNQINVAPQLGPLSLDSSSSRIDSYHHPLLITSPAINGGNPTGCKDRSGNLIPFDQLGRVRIQRDRCDIGAVESTFNANPISITTLSLSNSTVIGGNSITGTVNINLNAPTGGVVVELEKSIDAPITIPATVIIPAGSKSQTFTINTSSISINTPAAITAKHANTQWREGLTVLPADHTQSVLTDLSLSTVRIGGSHTLTGTVRLDIPVPTAGIVINLATNAPSIVSLPASVTVDAGNTSKVFSIGTVPVDFDVDVVIYARNNEIVKEASLVVFPLQFVFLPLLTK